MNIPIDKCPICCEKLTFRFDKYFGNHYYCSECYNYNFGEYGYSAYYKYGTEDMQYYSFIIDNYKIVCNIYADCTIISTARINKMISIKGIVNFDFSSADKLKNKVKLLLLFS